MVIFILKNGFLDLDFVKYFILLCLFYFNAESPVDSALIFMQCQLPAITERAGGWGLGSQDSRNTQHLPDAE